MQTTLELQTYRFWCTARTIRHGYHYGTDTIGSLTPEQKLEEIEYQIRNFTFSKHILERFADLRKEVMGDKANESTKPAKSSA